MGTKNIITKEAPFMAHFKKSQIEEAVKSGTPVSIKGKGINIPIDKEALRLLALYYTEGEPSLFERFPDSSEWRAVNCPIALN